MVGVWTKDEVDSKIQTMMARLAMVSGSKSLGSVGRAEDGLHLMRDLGMDFLAAATATIEFADAFGLSLDEHGIESHQLFTRKRIHGYFCARLRSEGRLRLDSGVGR